MEVQREPDALMKFLKEKEQEARQGLQSSICYEADIHHGARLEAVQEIIEYVKKGGTDE